MKRYIIAALIMLSGAAFGQGRNVAFDSLRVKVLLNLNGAKIVKTGYLVVEIDSTVHDGVIRAAKFYGDGSNLTGITGSLLAAPDDLELIADNNSDQAGDIEFVFGDTVFAALERSSIYGDVVLVIGRRNSAVTDGVGLGGFDPGIQHHSSSSSSLSLSSFSSPGNARQAYLTYNAILQRVQMGSSSAGNPTGPNIVPVAIAAGAQTYLLVDTTDNVVLQGGDHNSFVPAAYTENIHQVMADTSVRNGLARIYGGGTGARLFTVEVDDYNDWMKIVSTKTGTVPGDSSWPIVFWVGGAGGDRVKIAEGMTEINNWLALHDVFTLDTDTYDYSEVSFYSHSDQVNNPSWAFGTYKADLDYPNYGFYIWQYQKSNGDPGIGPALTINDAGQVGIGTMAEEDHISKLTVEGSVTSCNPVELPGAAWFGAQRDTIAGMIPAVSFSNDTAYYDLGMQANAVRIDSLWLDVMTEDTAGDSARFILGYAEVDFGEDYDVAFATQNSDYVDQGAGGLRKKIRFTSASISLSADHRLLLKLYRDNAIANNCASVIKLAGVTLFGKGLK